MRRPPASHDHRAVQGRARRCGILTLLALVLVAGLPAGASAAGLGCGDNSAGTEDLPGFVSEILADTNAHRAERGLAPLALDPMLTKASAWKARDLGLRDYFSHEDPMPGGGARTPWERLVDCGYDVPTSSRAENIAAGQQSGSAFTTAWINSPGHRANIENGAMRFIGIAAVSVPGSTYGTYAVQMFSSKSSGVAAPTPPAAPTIDRVTLVADGSHVDVCPTVLANGVTFSPGPASGVDVQVSTTVAGCVRVAAPVGTLPGTAVVPYRAVGAAGSSASTNLTVVVELPRTLAGGGPAAGARTALRGSSARVARVRCGRTTCWRLTVSAVLRTSSGAPVVGQRIAVARVGARGPARGIGTAVTNRKGVATIVRVLRPPKRGTTAWLTSTWRSVRLQFAGTAAYAGATAVARVRR